MSLSNLILQVYETLFWGRVTTLGSAQGPHMRLRLGKDHSWQTVGGAGIQTSVMAASMQISAFIFVLYTISPTQLCILE